MQNMGETKYRLHLYWYKQKIWQCELLLAHIGSILALNTIPPSLASSAESTVSPTPCPTSQEPPRGTREVSQP